MELRRVGFLGCAIGLSIAASAWAHDFWIAPSAFLNGVDSPISFQLRVGDNFRGDPFPRRSDHFDRFQVFGPTGDVHGVPGLEGKDPAGYFRLQQPGLYIVGYSSRPNLVTLAPPKFRDYLREEGLERVLSRLPETAGGEPIRESFSRCAKSLVWAGELGGEAPGEDRRIGLLLELVAESVPYRLSGGGDLPVRIYWRDQPLEGALVAAMKRESEIRLEARSDGEGRVQFTLTPGVWLVKAVHMVESEPELGTAWHSRWASLTFEIPAA